MSLTNSPIWFGSGATGGGSFYPTLINDSLRWPTSGYQLFRTVGTPTDAKKHTHAFWVKVNPGTTQTLNSVYANASGYYSNSGINSDGRIIFGADYARYYYSTMKLRDPSSWVHILQVLDSTEASSSDRMKLYVNGVRQTSFTNFATVPLNWTGSYHAINGYGLRIGRTYTGAGFNSSLLSYTSEYIFVDGQALDPTDFGQFQDGVWIPDTYAGTYGNNGYKLDFSNPSNIGEDSSGNSNNFSVSGLATHDVMPDTPTNNFATLNVLTKGTSNTSLAEGNLKANATNSGAGSNWGTVFSSHLLPTTGKYYVEGLAFINTGSGNNSHLGVLDTSSFVPSASNITYAYTTGEGFDGIYVSLFNNNARPVSDGVLGTAEGSLTGTTVVAMLAVDIDNGKVWAGYDGTWLNSGNPAAGTNQIATRTFSDSDTIAVGTAYNGSNDQGMFANFGQDSTFAGATTAGGNTDANGVGDFKYAPPSGFLALCSANLPEPTIIDGSKHFNTVLWTGDGTASNAITGVGFEPDLVWTKARNYARHHWLFDQVRGAEKWLQSSNTDPEADQDAGLMSFDADGFTYKYQSNNGFNTNNETYASWNWKAGTSFSNSAGTNGATIASSGSVNTKAGFSIVSYVGTGVAGTVYHGLSSTPEFIIIKDRDYPTGRPWGSYHFKLNNGVNPEDERIQLNESTGETNDTFIFNSTAPTSNVFSLGTSSWNNTSGNDIIAYAFHSVDGYSKAGSYAGNSSTDGPFIYTGFRPAWILIKKYAGGTASNWHLHDTARDTYNSSNTILLPDSTSEELVNAAFAIDVVSNGFKLRNSDGSTNGSSLSYIYLAFAETPFKYANAR